MKKLIAILALISGTAQALPSTLTIGYQGEGQVDASTAGCTAFVKDVTAWDGVSLDQGISKVCAARRNHVDAYEALQESYNQFTKTIATDNRLNAEKAVISIQRLMKNCVEFRTALTTGGHNVSIDIIPNEIASECLKLGRRLLDEQSIKYMGALQ